MQVKYVHNTLIHNTKAAEIIVPIILQRYKINSVVDVGCGIGTWLSVFFKSGIEILGIDGDNVDRNLLCIDEANFKCIDLNQKFSLEKKFDLAICLEVAEHLEEKSAKVFIECLTNLSDLIIFSAAIPGQGGQNHLNEQYPDYWLKIFDSMGYYLIDDIKSEIWDNADVEWWYKQNMMILKKAGGVIQQQKLFFAIHPVAYKLKTEEVKILDTRYSKLISGKIPVLSAIKILLKSLKNSIR